MSEEVSQTTHDVAYWQQRATQAEQRERIAAEASNGQQQSYRELETLYQAAQERAIRAERFKNIRQDEAGAQLQADNAALREAITSFLAANTYSTIGSRRTKLRQLTRDAHPGQALLAELEAARTENAYLRGWIRSECSVVDADINEAMAVDAAKAAKKGTTP